jgi:hypothetical protein
MLRFPDSEPVANEIPWKVVPTASVLGLLADLGHAAWRVVKCLAGGGDQHLSPFRRRLLDLKA